MPFSWRTKPSCTGRGRGNGSVSSAGGRPPTGSPRSSKSGSISGSQLRRANLATVTTQDSFFEEEDYAPSERCSMAHCRPRTLHGNFAPAITTSAIRGGGNSPGRISAAQDDPLGTGATQCCSAHGDLWWVILRSKSSILTQRSPSRTTARLLYYC